MDSSDTYKTLAAPSEGSYSQLRSRFLAFAYPVGSEAEATDTVKKLKNKYHDARHVAYAYQIGEDGETWRANDDGEPSGTAGRPIHAVLRSFELTDTLLAVVRYYGGTPLGAKNLGRAYVQAAKDALDKAQIKTNIITQRISLTVPYPAVDQILRTARAAGAHTQTQYNATDVTITIDVARSLSEKLSQSLEKKTTAKIVKP